MRFWILYAIAAIFAVAVIGGSIALSAGKGGRSGNRPTQQIADTQPPRPTAATSEPEPDPTAPPVPADFSLALAGIDKQRFRSAGHNLAASFDTPTYSVPTVSDEQEFTVVCDLLGGESRPETHCITVRGDNVEFFTEQQTGTGGSAAAVTAKVADVPAS